MEKANRRLLNLIRKLRDGDDLFNSVLSPRITKAEIAEIDRLTGCGVQIESLHGAEKGSPRAVYALDIDKFRVAADAILAEARRTPVTLTPGQLRLLDAIKAHGTGTPTSLGLKGKLRLRHLEGLGFLTSSGAGTRWQLTAKGHAALAATNKE